MHGGPTRARAGRARAADRTDRRFWTVPPLRGLRAHSCPALTALNTHDCHENARRAVWRSAPERSSATSFACVHAQGPGHVGAAAELPPGAVVDAAAGAHRRVADCGQHGRALQAVDDEHAVAGLPRLHPPGAAGWACRLSVLRPTDKSTLATGTAMVARFSFSTDIGRCRPDAVGDTSGRGCQP